MAYSFNDCHIAIRTVHSVKHVPTHQSSITRHGKVALSVKYVAADLSSITTVPSGTDCQICHELRHTLGHHVKSRDIVPVDVSRFFVLLCPGCRFLRSDGQCKGPLFQATVPRRCKEHLRPTVGALLSRILEGALGPKWPHFLSTPLGCGLEDVQLWPWPYRG